MANGDTAVATSSRYIFRESYSGNSQHSTNFRAPGTSSYIDGGMGISGDVEALYLRYSRLLLDTIIHNLLDDILFLGFIDVGRDWRNVFNAVRFSLLYIPTTTTNDPIPRFLKFSMPKDRIKYK